MKGKHTKPIVHAMAYLYRERLRLKIAGLVKWKPLIEVEPGCTAIIGMCSRLPHVLAANVRCLSMSRWPQLKQVIVTADCTRDAFPPEFEREVTQLYPELHIKFCYYSAHQSKMAEALKLPYVYSWLSWCVALEHVTTGHVLIHDYDALVLGETIRNRYESFAASDAKVQGIAWYQNNGLEAKDCIATTFEAFMDTTWLRSVRPVELFNKLRIVEGRSIDFDTTLDMQYRLPLKQRTMMPMNLDQLVHPSQMIHQYTMFRRSPGAALPSASIPMIPLFTYLGGQPSALEHGTRALEHGQRNDLDLLGDGTRINLALLSLAEVDWVLKQAVQACMALQISPDNRVYRYGEALYRIIKAPDDAIWRGDFTDRQREWIGAASSRPYVAAVSEKRVSK